MCRSVSLNLLVCLVAATAGCRTASMATHARQDKELSEIVGSTHVMSNYYFGTQNNLNEGADRLLAMGTKVIKVWLYTGKHGPEKMYQWNSDWPKADNLVDAAKLPYWRDLFHKPFTTYILTVTEMVPMEDYYWTKDFTVEQEAEVQRQIYELAKYLLTEYQGTGKTFILSNHETDWHLVDEPPGNWDAYPTDEVYENTIRWFSARQRGVEQARQEVGMTHGVRVFHSGEVVHVVKSMKEGKPSVVTKVLPRVEFDLISYSCWDATVIGGIQEKKLLGEALDYIAEHAIESEYFGKKNVYIGEYGLPENEYNEALVLGLTQNVVETGLQWGCPYIVYWQLYCNEPTDRDWENLPNRDNAESRGFWLIRADGSTPMVYDYFKRILKPKG